MITVVMKRWDIGTLISILARDLKGDSRGILVLGVGLMKTNIDGAVTRIKAGNA